MRCVRCGRPLRIDSPSGYGRVCAEKAGHPRPRRADATADVPDPNQLNLFITRSNHMGNDKTVTEAKAAKRQLEDEILDLLVKYRNDTGLVPSGVQVDTAVHETAAGATPLLVGVRVIVEV